ncbi:MAG: ATP-binding cassette domain-containing protein, partial [Pseudomonadota bacterium]
PEGHALVDGRPQPILPALRGSAVALVPQKPLILPGTVAQNILFPDMDTEIDAARAQEILTALQLDLPLDRNVGEDGKQISGGQAQRLAIARALYAQPSLLVLDEATSHLDQRASDAVWQAIASFCPDATLVAVSHMAVPTAYFDKEVRVLDGRLSEVAQTA